jgi:hypothetical protein
MERSMPFGRRGWTRYLLFATVCVAPTVAARGEAGSGPVWALRLPLLSAVMRTPPPGALRSTWPGANRLIVGLRPGLSPQECEAAATRLGGRLHRIIPRFRMAIVVLPGSPDVQRSLQEYAAAPEFESAETDLPLYPAAVHALPSSRGASTGAGGVADRLLAVPPDPHYADQWHHPLMRCPEAWNISTGSPDVVIAMIDAGVDFDHPDIAPKIFVNPDEIPGNHTDDDGNGYIDDVSGWDFYNGDNSPEPIPDGQDNDGNGSPDDNVAYGTLTAGLAAAAANGFGTVGVDWQARILPLQVFPDDGGTAVSTVVEAMAYAIDMGVDVINLSLGGDFYVASFDTPIREAYQAGIVVVASNSMGSEFTGASSTWASPVCNDGPNLGVDNFVLGVGATDRDDRRAVESTVDSSGYRFVDVSAPGASLFGPRYQNPDFPAFASFFGVVSGTGYAAPLASGLAALLRAQMPAATNAEIIEHIRQTADDIDGVNPAFAGKLGTGRINAAAAFGLRPPALTWTGGPGFRQDGVHPNAGRPVRTAFQFSVKVTDPDGSEPDYVRLLLRKDGERWRSHPLQASPGQDIAEGRTYMATLELPPGDYEHCFRAEDAHGYGTGEATRFTAGPYVEFPPTLSWLGATGYEADGVDPDEGAGGDTRFRFKVLYSDADGHAPRYVSLHLRRNGKPFWELAMLRGAGDYTEGRVYRRTRQLPPGNYEHCFKARDRDGLATGEATEWTPGPLVGPRTSVALTSLAAVPTNAGTQITFSLSAAAQVQARILNIAGRPVKTLCHAKDCEAGTSTLLWNAHSDSGLAVPNGTYLVEVSARTGDGKQARGLTQVRLENR